MCRACSNRSALVAGFTLTAMSFGWPLGATIAARDFFARFGLRGTLLLGGALLPLGSASMLFLRPGLPPLVAGAGSLIMGLGMGFLSTASIVLIQGSVGWEERGAATASNVFSRNLGSTFGADPARRRAERESGRHTAAARSASTKSVVCSISPAARPATPRVQAALGHSLHLTFWAMFLITVSALAAATLVPRVTLAATRPAE